MAKSSRKQTAPTLEFIINSRRLSGTIENLSWGSTLYNCPELYAWPEVVPAQPIVLPKRNGRMLIELWGHVGWRFNVFCKVLMSAPEMVVRWDSLMSAQGPASGIATFDQSSGEWYFTTPEGVGDTDHGIVTIDSQTKVEGPGDQTMAIEQIRVIAVRTLI